MSTPSDPAAPNGSQPTSSQLSAEDLITLNEEIAGMAKAGLPLDQGLTALARDMGRGRLQKVTKQLGDDLRSGLTLPAALERQKGRLPPFYATLLNAGIRSGRLADVLGTLTLHARAVADMRSAIVSSLLYPAVVLCLGCGLLVFVATAILPRFMKIFGDFKMRVPYFTQILFFISEHPLEILVIPPLVLVMGFFVIRRLLLATSDGRIAWARFVYSLPLVGTLFRSARLAAFTDLLGILVDKSIPLPEGLRLAAQASSDPLLAEGADQIEKELRQGIPLGKALWHQLLVPELVVWMIAFGESHGTLAAALHQVAQLYRRQAEGRARLLRTILPPLLIVILAVGLGTALIMGLMAPIFALMEGLSGGKGFGGMRR